MMGSGFGRGLAEAYGCMIVGVIIVSMVVGVALWEGICWIVRHVHWT